MRKVTGVQSRAMPKQNYAVIRTHTIMMGDVSWHIVGFFVGFGSLYFFFYVVFESEPTEFSAF